MKRSDHLGGQNFDLQVEGAVGLLHRSSQPRLFLCSCRLKSLWHEWTHRMQRDYPVYLLDEDESFRSSAEAFFSAASIRCIALSAGDAVEKAISPDSVGCLIVGLDSPVAFLSNLVSRADFHMPVIVLSRTADVATAVKCMRLGAMDYLLKPISLPSLLPIVRDALAEDERRQGELHTYKQACDQLSSLTDLERKVLQLTCEGVPRNQIIHLTDLANVSVARHLANCVSKTRTRNIAKLLQLAKAARFNFFLSDHANLLRANPMESPLKFPTNAMPMRAAG